MEINLVALIKYLTIVSTAIVVYNNTLDAANQAHQVIYSAAACRW